MKHSKKKERKQPNKKKQQINKETKSQNYFQGFTLSWKIIHNVVTCTC